MKNTDASYNAINKAAASYLVDKSTSSLNFALKLIREYIESEVDKFLFKHTTDVERDDLIQEAHIQCWLALTKYYTPDGRDFTYLMASVVHNRLSTIASKERKYQTKISKLNIAANDFKTKRGRQL